MALLSEMHKFPAGKKKVMVLRRSAIMSIFGLKEIEQFLGYERGGAGYF